MSVRRGPRFGRVLATLGLLPALVLAAPARAQDDFGTTAATVLRVPAGTRSIALGEAYSAVRGDELSIFFNPGGLASAPRIAAGASYQSYIAGSDLVTLSGAARLGPGTLGLGVHHLDFGSVEEVVEDPRFGGQTGERTGNEVGASETVVALAYGIELAPRLGLGLGTKLVRAEIAGESGIALAADVGARWQPFERRPLAVGVALQSVGSNLELGGRSDPLPRAVRAGAAYELGDAGSEIRGLGVLELIAVRGGATRVAAGLEATRGFGEVAVSARAGLETTTADESLSDALTFGAGLRVGAFRLDYAHLGFDVFGATHRFGLAWSAP